MKKKQMCVDFNAYLSGVTHMRQEFAVCEIKSHFSIVCRFYLFSHTKKHKKEQNRCIRETINWNGTYNYFC